MKTCFHSLGRACVFALLVSHPSVAVSESLALVLTNSNYSGYGDAQGVADRRAVVDGFEDAGFRIIGAQNLSVSDLHAAAIELHDALQRADVDRLAIVLSGHFVAGSTDSWLLGSDAEEISDITAGAAGLSVAAITRLASAAPGRALVVLIPALGNDLPTGFGLTPRLGALDLPQGVTLATGPARETQQWIDASILTPGKSLAAAAQDAPDTVEVAGFLSDRISFIASDAPSKPTVPTPGTPSALAELSFWDATRAIGSATAYESYLQRYPQGLFAADARARIAEIRATPRQQADAGEAALALNRVARRDVQRDLSLLGFDPRGVDGVFGPGSRAAISAHQRSLGQPETGFLNAEQLRILRRDAAVRAAELEREAQERREVEETQDRAYWDSTGRGQDEAGLRAYLQRYPDGLFADLAQQRLDQIDDDSRQQAAAEERNLWDRSRQQDTPEAYRQFMQAFPDSTFTEAARARLAQIDAEVGNKAQVDAARAEEAQVAGDQVVRALVEQRLNQIGLKPGAADGNFNEETRRAIRRFQQATDLPVTGYVTQATMVRLLASGTLRRN
jgi:peptidoglycan hydrolase-like protein with peptidoglycan-binding domain